MSLPAASPASITIDGEVTTLTPSVNEFVANSRIRMHLSRMEKKAPTTIEGFFAFLHGYTEVPMFGKIMWDQGYFRDQGDV